MADEKKKRELAKLLSQLKGMRGSGTELITVYIPEGYPIAEVAAKLRGEYSQAGNIKSKSTRNNVQAALEKILQYLKVFRATPKNGIAIFCGNISRDPSKIDIELYSISPPLPLQIQMYRCDSEFVMDPLEALGGKREKYGLVAIDGHDATLAVMEGNTTKIVRRLTYLGPAKTHKGGSSAARYDRTVLEATDAYYRNIGDAMNQTLFASGITRIIVGGPGPVKDNFLKMKPFNYQFKILGVIDIGYTDEYGISELAKKAVDVVSEEKTVREKQVLEKFMKEVIKDGLATYGIKEVLEAIQLNKAEVVLLSEKFPFKRANMKCAKGHEEEIFREEGRDYKCSVCAGKLSVVKETGSFSTKSTTRPRIGG